MAFNRYFGVAYLLAALILAFVLTTSHPAPAVPLGRSTEPADDEGRDGLPFTAESILSPSGALRLRTTANGALYVSLDAGPESLVDTQVMSTPVFSPDEKDIAYLKYEGQVVLASIGPTTQRRTVFATLSSVNPPLAFSPTGRYLAFVSCPADCVPGIYVADLSTQPAEITQVTNKGVTRAEMKSGASRFLPVPTRTLTFAEGGITWIANGTEYSSPAPPY